MEGKKPKIPAPWIALFLALAITAIAVPLARDAVVIQSGIRAYSAMLMASRIAAGLSGALAGFMLARYRKALNGQPAAEAQDPPDKKPLDEDGRKSLYQELLDFGEKKWKGVSEISTLLGQLDSVDAYQAELGRLLDQSEYLRGKPAEIIQRAEDCMYINVRKLLNYMRILQTRDPYTMKDKASECARKNADLLKKIDDFVTAVVGYVNGDMAPGEEQKTKDYIDSYMFVVLDAIELPETYLK